MIGLLPVLLYLALVFFAVGLVDFLWHLNEGLAIYITVLCGVVVVFHTFTTVTPFFTTRTPFKTPLSNFLGNLWRGMLQGELAVKGLVEKEEMEAVESQTDILDQNCFKWLKESTDSAESYSIAARAEHWDHLTSGRVIGKLSPSTRHAKRLILPVSKFAISEELLDQQVEPRSASVVGPNKQITTFLHVLSGLAALK